VVTGAADVTAQRHGVVAVRARMPVPRVRQAWETEEHDIAL
jgi:hypothetical protein